MLVLALETSGALGSLALARDGRVLGRSFLTEPRQHASRLLLALEELLRETRLTIGDVEGVVVGAGPGSFTGVRIAAATAKGLAHALEVPLWAFSSLAAGALSDLSLPPGAGPPSWPKTYNGAPPSPRWVLFDARGERVYAAAYRVEEVGLEVLEAPRATTLGELLAGSQAAGFTFVGDGAVRHRERIQAAGLDVLGPPAGFPTADGLVRLMSVSRDARSVSDLGGWEPEYLRASNAERERKG